MRIIIKCNEHNKENFFKMASLGFYTQLNYYPAVKAKQRYFQTYNK